MSATAALLITLVVYKIVLLGVGVWASSRNRDDADFYIGGRRLGPWVASISAAASSSSAWTLLGVSGKAYADGMAAIWLLPACWMGFAINWWLIAPRLRREGVRTGAITLTEYLAHDAPPRWRRALVVLASLVILGSLLVYLSSQFQAAGKTFTEVAGFDFRVAVLIGGGVVLLYTLAGGFWAVAVTDLIQGLVMAFACLLLPIAGLVAVGGPSALMDGLHAAGAVAGRDLFDPWGGATGAAALGLLIGTFGIGLGYPGQPHVVNRFLAVRSEDDVRRARTISLVWAAVVYAGMIVAGWCARVLLEPLADREAALIGLAAAALPAVGSGIVVAAILSAIMSTADSQLLVCGSTVAYDLPGRSGTPRLLLDRITVLVIGLGALAAALWVPASIFGTVLFAWSALGAAFGPLLLVRLLRGPVRPAFAFAAMLAGAAISVIWYAVPALKAMVYEIIPAFAVALALALAGSRPARRTPR
jgi:sodium/proline symporter